MRVTSKTLLSNYLSNLNKNLVRMQEIQNQMSSGKEISKPSDDPFGTVRALNIETSIMQNSQYLKNIEDSMSWSEITDSALGGMTDVIQRVRELIIYGANGTLTEGDRKALAEEIKQNIEQIAEIGNTNYDGRYIFSGQMTTTKPFDVVAGELFYSANDNGLLSREISKNVTIEINIPGNEIMNSTSESLSLTLKNIFDRLSNGDQELISTDSIEKLDTHLDHLLSIRAKTGAKYNRIEAAKQRNEAETTNMTQLFSQTIDIDIAEKVMAFSMMEMVYNASLATGAKILQPTLLDYLR